MIDIITKVGTALTNLSNGIVPLINNNYSYRLCHDYILLY